MASRFAPIPRQTVASSVRDAIEREIRSGELQPGSPLPSERELSEQFDVARTSVREAVQGLLSVGLVEKRGNRSFVAEQLPEVRLDNVNGRSLRVRDLFAVRMILELPIARLAAANESVEAREAVYALSQQFHPDMTLDDFRHLDRQLHLAVAMACGNTLLAELCNKVLESLFSGHEFTEMLTDKTNDAAVHRTIAASVAAHHRIGAAIRDGDPERAEAEMARHLGDVEERMSRQMV